MGHHIELQCFFRCEAYNKKQCWVLCCHFIEDIWMSFIFSESFRKRYTHANVPTSLVDGQGSCVLFVGFTLNVPYRYISIFLLCVENSWIYIQCIWFVMFACFLCWLPLLLLSFCSHQWLISRLLAVTFLAHWILDPDLCKVPPKISLRFCLIFWGSEIVSVVSFLIFLFLYQPHLPSAPFKPSRKNWSCPLLSLIWIFPDPILLYDHTQPFHLEGQTNLPETLWELSRSSGYKTIIIP